MTDCAVQATATPPCTKEEMLVVRAAREVGDADVVFVGIGLPNRAANLAKQTHAPGARLIYESGVYGAAPDKWPQSIGDPCLVVNALAVHSMADLFLYYLQRGLINLGFLGGAQIDRHGNINSTVIGSYAQPQVRLPGSGGACEIALNTRKVVITIPQSLKHFPAHLDFATSPGVRLPDGSLPRGTEAPSRSIVVITDMAVFGIEAGAADLELRSLHPGVTLDMLQRNMGWQPRLAMKVMTTEAPSARELEILRSHALA